MLATENSNVLSPHQNFFIVFLCELCAFARDLFGSGLSGLGVSKITRNTHRRGSHMRQEKEGGSLEI